MSKCVVCEGRSQLFLCTTHLGVLQSTLKDLPWWLNRLGEASIGKVKMGDGGRRATRAHELDEYTGPDDEANAERLDRDICAGKFDLDRVLAVGRVNGKAVRLYGDAANDLGTWVRHLAESRGTPVPALRGPQSYARWLRKHANAIAADEAAGELYKSCVDLTDRIRHVVNRPEPPRYCGPCTTVLTTEQRTILRERDEEDREVCSTQLYARRGVATVECPFCHAQHTTEELHTALWAQLQGMSFTLTELLDVVLPQLDCHVKRRYLQYRVKRINPSGYEIHPKTHQQVPRYLFADVSRVLEQEGQIAQMSA